MAFKPHKFDYFPLPGFFFAPLTATEIRACYELCRAHNNIGFWVVYLPTGESVSREGLIFTQPRFSMVHRHGLQSKP
jgi:hypothetical protein